MEGFNVEQCENDIATYVNQARSEPQVLIEEIKARLAAYEGKNFKTKDGVLYQSFEGKDAPEECVACLENAKSKPSLQRIAALDLAAKDLCDHLGESGDVSHEGKDGSKMGDRISKHGKWTGKIGEVIGVQPTTGLDFVLQWMIDDGVKSRGDRKSILSQEFTKFGVAVGTHKTYKTVAVVVFAEKFAPEGEELPEPEAKENPDLIKSLPDGLSELPEDAESMKVRKNLTMCDGNWKTKYTITYTLKDGGERELVKEYDGKK